MIRNIFETQNGPKRDFDPRKADAEGFLGVGHDVMVVVVDFARKLTVHMDAMGVGKGFGRIRRVCCATSS